MASNAAVRALKRGFRLPFCAESNVWCGEDGFEALRRPVGGAENAKATRFLIPKDVSTSVFCWMVSRICVPQP